MTLLILGLLALTACREQVSRRPPIHVNPNMDDQERYDPQEANPLFADGMAQRPPEPGAVARGQLHEDSALHRGKQADGSFVQDNPLPVTAALLARGRERYNIYCSPCHGQAGDGQGMVAPPRYDGMIPPPSYHDGRLRVMADGELFGAITDGVRTMPSYARQIPVEDRWAIVAYIRALQRSQRTVIGDVPAELRDKLEVNP
jgi:mono/diheme cytochrome c family protein